MKLDDRFTLIELIGRGAHAEVWAAEDGARRVAVKLAAEDQRAAIAKESEILRMLDHPSVPALVALGSESAAPYLAMELVRGAKTLEAELELRAARGERFRRDAALRILGELAGVLDHAHALGVVHRDLKPRNVMLLERGPWWFVKLLDFGAAKIAAVSPDEATTKGRVVGSPLYMAPEQAEGRAAGPSADVFALGAIAFELLTLRRAFARDADKMPLACDRPVPAEGENAPAVVTHRLVAGPRPAPSELIPGLGDAVDDVLRRALAIDPASRPARASDLVRALESAWPPVEVALPAEDRTTARRR